MLNKTNLNLIESTWTVVPATHDAPWSFVLAPDQPDFDSMENNSDFIQTIGDDDDVPVLDESSETEDEVPWLDTFRSCLIISWWIIVWNLLQFSNSLLLSPNQFDTFSCHYPAVWLKDKPPQSPTNHHKLPQTTTHHRKPPQTTTRIWDDNTSVWPCAVKKRLNHRKPPPEFGFIFSMSNSRVTFCPWCLARLGNHAKGYNKRLHCIASACGSPSFHRYLRSVMPNYFLSFVAPTTVSMEMTWHFFEFRMKHLSAKGEEYSCNLHLCSAAGYLA